MKPTPPAAKPMSTRTVSAASRPRLASSVKISTEPSAYLRAKRASLDFLVGTWDCFAADKFESNQRVFAVTRIRTEADDTLLSETKVTSGHRNGVFLSRLSYNPMRQCFVESNISGPGESGHASSPGWQNDRIVFQGIRTLPDATQLTYQKIYWKLSDNRMIVTAQTTQPGQSPQVENHALCNKRPAQHT